jgi:hypothetical protein
MGSVVLHGAMRGGARRAFDPLAMLFIACPTLAGERLLMADEIETALDESLDSLAAMLGLEIKADWRSAVLDNMKTIARAAHLIMSYPVEDHDEAAPTFHP